MNDSSDIILKKDFIRQCEDLTADIIALSIDLNDGKININNDINRLIDVIKEMKDYKENLIISDDVRVELNKKFDEVKKDFVSLKNKHITIYNEKVDYINGRVNTLTTKLNTVGLSQNIKKLVGKLSPINRCEIYVDGKWNQNGYLETLDYDKLDVLYNNVSEIERILKINVDEPLDLFTSVNYVNNEIKKIKRKLKDELSLPNINTNLDMCVTLLERVVDLDIQHELMREKLSKEMFSKYSDKIVKLRNNIKDLEDKLLDRKSCLVRKTNYYAEIFNKLDQISNKYDMLSKKILEYEGRCTSKTVAIFNDYLNYLTNCLFDVQKEIKEYDEKYLLNQEQKDNLYKKLNVIAEKHKKINIKSNEEPILLKEEEKKNFIDEKLSSFDKELDDLDKKISKLERIIKDKNIRNEYDYLILDRKEKLDGFENLLSYYKTHEPEKYDKLKLKVDKLRDRFNNINDKYYSKCPLRVKTVRNIKNLYKKHHKLGLISAGLSTLALLSSANALIPAIMHGNALISANVPVLKGMMQLFNKILGGVSGMTLTSYGRWKLASGAMLNASTATTAILKSLVTFSAGVVVLISPTFVPQIISKVKELVDKIKKYELKDKFVRGYDKGKDYVSKKVDNIRNDMDKKREEKDIKKYYEDLYDEYCDDSELSIDEFCEKNELSDRDKKILKLMEEEENLKVLRKQELSGILEENIGRRKK